MQHEELYLRDIIEAVDAIENFLHQISKDKFIESELLQSAVLHKLAVIGEAAARISDDLKKQNSEIEWKAIIGFRNIVVHEYFSINWEIVWTTATIDIPVLRTQVCQIMEQNFSDEKQD
jgi:uncharacterized protein with HEPN domain